MLWEVGVGPKRGYWRSHPVDTCRPAGYPSACFPEIPERKTAQRAGSYTTGTSGCCPDWLLVRSWWQDPDVLSVFLQSWWREGILQDSWYQTQSMHRVHTMGWRNSWLCPELPGMQGSGTVIQENFSRIFHLFSRKERYIAEIVFGVFYKKNYRLICTTFAGGKPLKYVDEACE